MDEPIRRIKAYKNYYKDFYHAQNIDVKNKLNWTLEFIKTTRNVPEKYLAHLTNTDGLYEIRVKVGSNIYRIFCFFDEGSLVVLLTAFTKKSQKTPPNEIDTAKKLKKEYYENK